MLGLQGRMEGGVGLQYELSHLAAYMDAQKCNQKE